MKNWKIVIGCIIAIALGIALVWYLTPAEQLKNDFNFYDHTPYQPEVKDNSGPSYDEWCQANPKLCKG